MELHRDRHLANRRIFPSIDIMKSGTRKEELLISKNQLDKMWMIRNTMQDTQEFTERFLRRLKETETNENFLESIERDMQDRKSTRLNSSHVAISYAVFCLKKKNKIKNNTINERKKK